MKVSSISKTVTHHINMGNYEWVEFSATASVEDPDDVTSARKELDKCLEVVLDKDLATVDTLTKESYAANWFAETEEDN